MAAVVRVDPEHRTFVLRGELDMSNAHELEAAIAAADWLDDGPVRFDIADLTFADSTGLRALMKPYAVGRMLIFDSPTPIVRRLLEILGYDSLSGVRIEDGGGSEESASG